ncbi:hypothetical protein GCM10018783_00750 [Streptomyces griseosporeus]|nr:hypothetical protein GCM10018783_00750 [Streptomyces griseosporeus]
MPSTTTYTYDTAIDPRGLPTSVTDSVAGTFSARYDADGALTSQTLPGGYSMDQTVDPTGATTSRVYTRTSDGTVLVSDSVTLTVHGQRATHTGTPGVTKPPGTTRRAVSPRCRTPAPTPTAPCAPTPSTRTAIARPERRPPPP